MPPWPPLPQRGAGRSHRHGRNPERIERGGHRNRHSHRPRREHTDLHRPSSTPKGSVSITTAGAFTYTPTAAARHAAAGVDALPAAKQDTFTVTINDGYGGTITKAVTVTVLGKNTAPTGYARVGWPNGNTGVVTGYISAGDADYDPLTYAALTTTKGTVTVTNTGSFTYTPTAAARHAAAAQRPRRRQTGHLHHRGQRRHGGTANITVTVTVVGKNTAPPTQPSPSATRTPRRES